MRAFRAPTTVEIIGKLMPVDTNSGSHVAFRIGDMVTNDLRILFAAAGVGAKIVWFTRAQIIFMAAVGGTQWEQFASGPAFTFSRKIESNE